MVIDPNLTIGILDSISEGLFTVDKNFRINFFNRAAEKMTGLNRENLQVVIPTKVKEYRLATAAAKMTGKKSFIRLGINRSVKNKLKNRLLYGHRAEGILSIPHLFFRHCKNRD